MAMMRVRGAIKVNCYLMLGILALMVHQIVSKAAGSTDQRKIARLRDYEEARRLPFRSNVLVVVFMLASWWELMNFVTCARKDLHSWVAVHLKALKSGNPVSLQQDVSNDCEGGALATLSGVYCRGMLCDAFAAFQSIVHVGFSDGPSR